MNRRGFFRGIAAATTTAAVAQVGAVERFLVGNYGVRRTSEWTLVDPYTKREYGTIVFAWSANTSDSQPKQLA